MILDGGPLTVTHSSLLDFISERNSRHPSHILLKERINAQWRSISWEHIWSHVIEWSELITSKLDLLDQPVAIISPNSAAELISELVVMQSGGFSVLIPHSYPIPLQVELLNNTQPLVVIMDKEHTLSGSLLPASTQMVIILERTLSDTQFIIADNSNVTPLTSHIKKIATVQDRRGVAGTDIPLSVLFTSGTTGKPKGVLLTHKNIISQQYAFQSLLQLDENDITLSYLPWYHSYGGLFERYSLLAAGGQMVLDPWCGKNITHLVALWKEIKPTVFFSVPRILAKLMGVAKEDETLLEGMKQRLKFIFTAASPISQQTFSFFKDHNIRIFQGWGLTETSPCSCMATLQSIEEASDVGKPIPGVQVKIDGNGDLYVRGLNVMHSYYHLPVETEQSIQNGWFFTGDIGMVTEQNTLKILGRSDGIFKLDNGEKVSLLLIESAFTGISPYIEHVVAVPLTGYQIGLLVFLNTQEVMTCVNTNRVETDDSSFELRDYSSEIIQLITPCLCSVNLQLTPAYLRIHRALLLTSELEAESGLLTPSQKIRREQILQRFHDEIEGLRLSDRAKYPLIIEIIS